VFLEGITITAVRDHQGEVTHYIGIIRDITQMKKLEQEIHDQAYRDQLTGLPNRFRFYESLEQAIGRSIEKHDMLAILFIDLDRFKRINDTLGHNTGDALLRAVSERLSGCVRPQDVVARLGGDEFVILLNGVQGHDQACDMAKRILSALTPTFHIEQYEFFISASIGISLVPDHDVEIESLMKKADIAMYQAKEAGRNNYQLYNEKQGQPTAKMLAMENSLHRAIEREQLEVYYQPQIDRDNRLCGVEALVRWNHPEWGRIPPAQFIPLAEATGLIVQIDEWVIRRACKEYKTWMEKGYPPIRLSVNLSMLHFQRRNLVQAILNILDENGFDPGQLNIEMTESVLIENPEWTMNMLNQLRETGIKIALDDFGVGFSSLNYLRRFQIDYVKIDRSFVQDMCDRMEDSAIVQAIIQMAHSMKLEVVGEGVETKEQHDILNALGCDEFQGYSIGKPMPRDQFDAYFRERMHIG